MAYFGLGKEPPFTKLKAPQSEAKVRLSRIFEPPLSLFLLFFIIFGASYLPLNCLLNEQ